MKKKKYVITIPNDYGMTALLYLENHCQALIFKTDKNNAQEYETETAAQAVIKKWGIKNATIQPI